MFHHSMNGGAGVSPVNEPKAHMPPCFITWADAHLTGGTPAPPRPVMKLFLIPRISQANIRP